MKNGKIPERIIELKNKSLYIQRFKKMIADHYIIENERLKYKKRNIENSNYKTIPYIFEIYKKIDLLHIENNHINLNDFKNILVKSDFYMEGIDIILKEYYIKCPICYSKYYATKIINQPKIILDEGPRYRYLCDIIINNKLINHI